MGRKKRKAAQLKPFCYYCDREFDDEKVLIQHQKAKHFKCFVCNRKLDTATGLIVHMLQVHKETVNKVPNAIPNRDNPELIVHGLAGVPIELINEKQAKLDAERGSVRQQKTAHTVFGMSVVNGFFNQMNAAGMFGVPTPAQGAPTMQNPALFNQMMAQLTQNAAGGLKPTMPGMFPPPIPSAPFSGAEVLNQAALANKDTPTGPQAGLPPPIPQTGWLLRPPVPPAAPSAPPARPEVTVPGVIKAARLVFDLPDDTISPEEMLAEHYGYVIPKQEAPDPTPVAS